MWVPCLVASFYVLTASQNAENHLLTSSPQGNLCVTKLFPPGPRERDKEREKAAASNPGHSARSSLHVVKCEASRNLKWSIANTGVISPIYKLSLNSPDSWDRPLLQISKPKPSAAFWNMFYFVHFENNIPPMRVQFGQIQTNPPGPNAGGACISIAGETPEEKAVWQILGEGNKDCVEWAMLCTALNLLDDEAIKAVAKNPPPSFVSPRNPPSTNSAPAPQCRPAPGPGPSPGPIQPQQQHPPPPESWEFIGPAGRNSPPPQGEHTVAEGYGDRLWRSCTAIAAAFSQRLKPSAGYPASFRD